MYNGYAIVIAWPETWCKQPGAWYDKPLTWLGFNKNHYYQLGHAAVVLVHGDTGACHYFDFGRYHAPHGHGRARGAFTDHELRMDITATIDKQQKGIENVQDIIDYLTNKPASHGSGRGYAAAMRIHFESAFAFAEAFQAQGFFKYGPFTYGGSNCSRFVNDVLCAGSPSLVNHVALKCPVMLTPTPMWNIRATGSKIYSTK
jgi:hypothetical protein